MGKTYRSEALGGIHEAASDLHDAGVMDKQTLRNFDALCLAPIRDMQPHQISTLRKRERVSQAVFARYLNVSTGLVSQWERGVKRPAGASLKLLTVVQEKGLSAIASLSMGDSRLRRRKDISTRGSIVKRGAWRGDMYCIYTDCDVPEEQGNWDHVFPLALGGKNQFAVWSDRHSNSVLGSQIEGVLARDSLLAFALRDSGVKGHGTNSPGPRWNKVTIDGRPFQVTWAKEKVVIWDSINRREVEDMEVIGKEMTATLRIAPYVVYRFLAKAALGGGYFLYGNVFRHAVDCDQLRALVFNDIETAQRERLFENSEIKICDRFHPDSHDASTGGMYRALCESRRRSMFVVVPHHDAIAFHIGVTGAFVGSMIVPATTDQLPTGGEHDLGHAIVLGPGDMERFSFRTVLQDFEKQIGEFEQRRQV